MKNVATCQVKCSLHVSSLNNASELAQIDGLRIQHNSRPACFRTRALSRLKCAKEGPLLVGNEHRCTAGRRGLGCDAPRVSVWGPPRRRGARVDRARCRRRHPPPPTGGGCPTARRRRRRRGVAFTAATVVAAGRTARAVARPATRGVTVAAAGADVDVVGGLAGELVALATRCHAAGVAGGGRVSPAASAAARCGGGEASET